MVQGLGGLGIQGLGPDVQCGECFFLSRLGELVDV